MDTLKKWFTRFAIAVLLVCLSATPACCTHEEKALSQPGGEVGYD